VLDDIGVSRRPQTLTLRKRASSSALPRALLRPRQATGVKCTGHPTGMCESPRADSHAAIRRSICSVCRGLGSRHAAGRGRAHPRTVCEVAALDLSGRPVTRIRQMRGDPDKPDSGRCRAWRTRKNLARRGNARRILRLLLAGCRAHASGTLFDAAAYELIKLRSWLGFPLRSEMSPPPTCERNSSRNGMVGLRCSDRDRISVRHHPPPSRRCCMPFSTP